MPGPAAIASLAGLSRDFPNTAVHETGTHSHTNLVFSFAVIAPHACDMHERKSISESTPIEQGSAPKQLSLRTLSCGWEAETTGHDECEVTSPGLC